MPRARTGTAYEKNNKWYVGVRLRDGRKWATPCPARADGVAVDQIHARAVAANLQRDYDLGRWDPEAVERERDASPVTDAPTTVIEYARAWMKVQTYASALDDSRRIANYLAPSALASLALEEVRPKHLLAFVDWLKLQPSERGGTLAPRSIRNAYSLVRRIFERAVAEERLAVSPCRLPRRALPELIDKNPASRSGWVFTREEVAALLGDERLYEDRRVLYAILFLTGMRFGEAAALKWSAWSPELQPLGRLVVATSIHKDTRTEKGTKTGIARQVPVLPALAKVLASWRRAGFHAYVGHAPGEEDYVIPTAEGRPRSVRKAHAALQRDLKTLGFRKRRLHDTRRTFISLLRDDGGRGEILRWITHDASKASMTDVYSTLAWSTLCAEALRLQLPEAPPPGLPAAVEPTPKTTKAEPERLATGSATAVGFPVRNPSFSAETRRGGRDSNPRPPA